MVSPGLKLETHLHGVADGTKVDILAEILIRCPEFNICRSAVLGQKFITDAFLPEGFPSFSMLGAEVMQGSRYPWLKVAQDTQVLQHTAIDACNFDKVIETCAGYWCRQYCNAVLQSKDISVCRAECQLL